MPNDSTVIAAGFAAAAVIISGLIGFWNSRLADKRAANTADGENDLGAATAFRERLETVEGRMRELDEEIVRLKEQLAAFSDRWRVVIGTIQQMFWQVFREWPEGHPTPEFHPDHLDVLHKAEVLDIIPAKARQPKQENNAS